jgi:hypothetical protein
VQENTPPSQRFSPQGAVTGIGSLPHSDPAQAVQFVARMAPELPFWPQLPQRNNDETMLAQALAPLRELLEARPGEHGLSKGAVVPEEGLGALADAMLQGPVDLPASSAAALPAFEQAVNQGQFPAARAIKGQLCGPLTLAFNLFEGQRTLAEDTEKLKLVSRYVCRLAQMQVRRLSEVSGGKPVIVALDEPMLGLAAPEPGYKKVQGPENPLATAVRETLEAIRQTGAVAGLHCCGAFDPALLRQVQPDLIMMDVAEHLDSMVDHPATLEFAKQRGLIGFGLVPTQEEPEQLNPAAMVDEWLSSLSHLGGERHGLLDQTIISASCGFGLLTVRKAEALSRITLEVSQRIRLAVQRLDLEVTH